MTTSSDEDANNGDADTNSGDVDAPSSFYFSSSLFLRIFFSKFPLSLLQ